MLESLMERMLQPELPLHHLRALSMQPSSQQSGVPMASQAMHTAVMQLQLQLQQLPLRPRRHPVGVVELAIRGKEAREEFLSIARGLCRAQTAQALVHWAERSQLPQLLMAAAPLPPRPESAVVQLRFVPVQGRRERLLGKPASLKSASGEGWGAQSSLHYPE